jgi:proteasome assembly chaperone 2
MLARALQPAVAHANIGELAIDCLISSYGLPLVARLEDDNMLPVVGNDAYTQASPGTLATALEVYHHAASNTFLLQQRAPALTGRQDAFAASMAEWIKASGFSRTVLVCGLDAQFRRDAQITDRAARFLSSGEEFSTAGTAAGMKELEEDVLQTEQELHPLLPPWTTLRAFEAAGVQQHVVLMRYAAEGDNMPDAVALAQDTHAVLQQLRGSGGAGAGAEQLVVRMPCSWAAALYGKSFQRAVHGG